MSGSGSQVHASREGGRKKDSAWLDVNDIENEKGKVMCKFCEIVISKKIERVREHLNKCKIKIQDDQAKLTHEKELEAAAENLLSPKPASRPSSSMSDISSSVCASGSSTPNPTLKRYRNSSGSMNAFITRTSVEKKKQIDEQLARFIFSQNIPFVAVEGHQFAKFCEEMRPGYKPPNRKAMSGRLLDTIHEEVLGEIKDEVSFKDTLVLTQDGWSSVHNDPIIAHCFNDGKKNFLLNIIDTGSAKKTGPFCFQLLDDAIQEIKRDFDKTVFAVCTDNENKMKNARTLIKRKYPDLLIYGCAAHYANLMQEDVTNDDVLKHIVAIQKYFRGTHKAHGMLKEKGGCMPQLPNETRWNSQVDCLETFVKNHPHYVSIKSDMLMEGEDMPGRISLKVDDIGLLRNAEHLLSNMRKFARALDQFQSDTCHISDSVHVWFSLMKDKVENIIFFLIII